MAKPMQKLTQAENKLLDKLLQIAKLEIDTSHLLVRPLDNGGMESCTQQLRQIN
jgi:RNase adaptor protein for sRNA GlmZ degradation